MNSLNAMQREKFDEEWIVLMLTARQIGLSADEVREFIEQTQAIMKEDT